MDVVGQTNDTNQFENSLSASVNRLWFTTLFFLVREWGLAIRVMHHAYTDNVSVCYTCTHTNMSA